MDEIVETAVEIDKEDKFVHQISKLLLGVAAGYIVGELVKVAYDRFVINRNSDASSNDN